MPPMKALIFSYIMVQILIDTPHIDFLRILAFQKILLSDFHWHYEYKCNLLLYYLQRGSWILYLGGHRQ